MQTSYQNEIVSKLSLQVSSFQEGFKILSNAKSLEEIARNFNHILRGSLLITDINILFKLKNNDNWKELHINHEKCLKCLKYIDKENRNQIEYHNEGSIKISILHPMIDGSFFGLLIGDKLDKTDYTQEDKIVLQMFLQLLDNAYQSYVNIKKEKQLVFLLNHRLLQLNTLIDTGIEISKLQNKNDLLEKALERAVSLTNASKGLIEISRNNKILGIIKLPNNINLEEVSKSQNRIETSVEYRGYKYSVKLIDKESRLGFTKFDDTDEVLLNAFARQVHAAVENEQLHKEALENETIKKELSVASSIQNKIIPEKLPQIEGYDIAGINISSKEVGGDYYDCKVLKNGKIAMIMADVTGKGVPASLLVSSLNASLNAYLEMNIPLEELALKLNKIIYDASTADKFITCFISILDPVTGELDIINAGHNPSLHLRKNKVLDKINAGGVAFGMFDMGLPFQGEKRKIEKGERILMFTDGIPEAMDENEEEYSDERLEKFCVDNCFFNADKFINELVADVRSFTKETPQSDDITALYLIRK